MAIKDAVVTLKGDQAEVKKIEIVKADDGSFKVAVYGLTKTSSGKDAWLEPAMKDVPASNQKLSDMWDLALPFLRQANGLE